MTQKPAHNPPLCHLTVGPESKRSDEIHHDIVIVPCVEADVSSRLSNCADNIQRLVTGKGCNLDGHDILDFSELAPESIRESASTHRRLQVETNDGQDLCHNSTVSEKHRMVGILEGG